jgi:hypothetical protein
MIMPAAKNKIVYLNHVSIGSASSWSGASLLLSAVLDRDVTVAETMRRGIEGPDFFYITMPRLTLISGIRTQFDNP